MSQPLHAGLLCNNDAAEQVLPCRVQAPDYPPYTSYTDDVPKDIGGFNMDFAALMEPECGIKVDFILSDWSECWTSTTMSHVTEYVGESIYKGYVHGCTAYTHTKGERGLSLEFTHSLLGKLKTGGILTRLNSGVPIVSPLTTNFTGIKLGDVTGWAPTSDTFEFNKNYCVEGHPQFFTEDAIITSLADGNDAAITALKDGTIDALYIYADQAHMLAADCCPSPSYESREDKQGARSLRCRTTALCRSAGLTATADVSNHLCYLLPVCCCLVINECHLAHTDVQLRAVRRRACHRLRH